MVALAIVVLLPLANILIHAAVRLTRTKRS